MSNNLDRLLTIVKQQADLVDEINSSSFRYKSVYRLIQETGRTFSKRVEPAPFKGKPKSCFQNCFEALWKYPQLSYCEGFAIDDNIPIAVSHAWLVNDASEVIDPTWVGKNFISCAYFGVVFNRKFVIDFATKTRVYGILDSDYLNEHQLLREGFPEGALHTKFHTRSL